ncbi:homeodomain-interacting protein kinase 2-like [Pelobates fuscus]|uniref:homeodomain-interacting protein kinase 2-like n=1 Tax=Pelobates fuscus TaxID=191477 RepID=UPI002FE45DAC
MTDTYKVLKLLGSGAFEDVVECEKHETGEKVAVKMLKKGLHSYADGLAEIDMLFQLNKENPDKFNVVKAFEFFMHEDRLCLVFEMLEMSLLAFMEQNEFCPLPVRYIRPIVQQVGTALAKLKSLGIIHTDLKPENIMLVDTSRHPFKVKGIDFGCAFHVSEAECSSYLQTRPYRAPEIILGLPFWEAIDMWSLGCITAELFTGWMLYPGGSEYDLIRFITHTQGLPPQGMLSRGTKMDYYFNRDMDSSHLSWRLKTVREYRRETGMYPAENRKYIFNCLDDMMQIHLPSENESSDILVEMADIWQCLDLIKQMLTMDPNKRITPMGTLGHAFITMAHLENFSQSSYVNPCRQTMEISKQQVRLYLIQEVCQVPPEMGTEDRDEDYKTPQEEEDPNKKIKVCQVPPEMGTEDQDEDYKTPQEEEDPKKKHAEAPKFANQVGIISDISNQTEDEPLETYKIPPAAEMETQDQQEVCQVPPETGTEDRDEDYKTPQEEEDPKKKIKVCQVPPEMGIEDQDEDYKTPQEEEDPKKKHAQALILANQMGIISEISIQTEDEPLGTLEISPPVEMEIQGQTPSKLRLQQHRQEVRVNGQVAQGLRDTGTTITLVQQHLVKPENFSNHTVALRVARGAVFRLPTARVHLNWGTGFGMVTVGIIHNMPAKVLLGNDIGPLTSAYLPTPAAKACPVATRSQARPMENRSPGRETQVITDYRHTPHQRSFSYSNR